MKNSLLGVSTSEVRFYNYTTLSTPLTRSQNVSLDSILRSHHVLSGCSRRTAKVQNHDNRLQLCTLWMPQTQQIRTTIVFAKGHHIANHTSFSALEKILLTLLFVKNSAQFRCYFMSRWLYATARHCKPCAHLQGFVSFIDRFDRSSYSFQTFSVVDVLDEYLKPLLALG